MYRKKRKREKGGKIPRDDRIYCHKYLQNAITAPEAKETEGR